MSFLPGVLAGQAESTILDYLCEYFNGTVDQMFNILLAGIREQVDTADMEERLLCRCCLPAAATRWIPCLNCT